VRACGSPAERANATAARDGSRAPRAVPACREWRPARALGRLSSPPARGDLPAPIRRVHGSSSRTRSATPALHPVRRQRIHQVRGIHGSTSVLRLPEAAGPVVHGHLFNPTPCILTSVGRKRCIPLNIGSARSARRGKRLEGAGRYRGSVSRLSWLRTRWRYGLQPLPARVPRSTRYPGPPPLRSVRAREKDRNVVGIVLEIGVERDDDAPAGAPKPAAKRRSALRSRRTPRCESRVLRLQRLEHVERPSVEPSLRPRSRRRPLHPAGERRPISSTRTGDCPRSLYTGNDQRELTSGRTYLSSGASGYRLTSGRMTAPFRGVVLVRAVVSARRMPASTTGWRGAGDRRRPGARAFAFRLDKVDRGYRPGIDPPVSAFPRPRRGARAPNPNNESKSPMRPQAAPTRRAAIDVPHRGRYHDEREAASTMARPGSRAPPRARSADLWTSTGAS